MKKMWKNILSKTLCSAIAVAMFAQPAMMVFADETEEVTPAGITAEIEEENEDSKDQTKQVEEPEEEKEEPQPEEVEETEKEPEEEKEVENTPEKPADETQKRPTKEIEEPEEAEEAEDEEEEEPDAKTKGLNRVIDLAVEADGEGYTYANDVYTIVESGSYELTPADGTVDKRVFVQTGVTASVMVPELTMESKGSAFTVESGATLTLEGLLEAYAYGDAAAIRCMAGGTLIIPGDSEIIAEAVNGAAIGGNKGESAGTITIRDNAFVYGNALSAAAIGGGNRGNGGTITIQNKAEVIAESGSGAAIGGGFNGAAGTITISNSAYIEVSTENSSCIGTGATGNGGSVSLLGGDIWAYSLTGSAIGGAGTNVTIKDGVELFAISDGAAAITASSQTGSTAHLIHGIFEGEFPTEEFSIDFMDADWESDFYNLYLDDVTKSFAMTVEAGEYSLLAYDDDYEEFWLLVDKNNPEEITIPSSDQFLTPVSLIFQEIGDFDGLTLVTFHANDGTDEDFVVYLDTGDVIELFDANELFATNKEFLYWTSKANGGTRYNEFDEVEIEGDSMEFYAQWKTDDGKDPVDPVDPKKPTKPTNTNTGKKTPTVTVGKSPHTSDSYSAIWWMMVIVSIGGLSACVVRMRKYSK